MTLVDTQRLRPPIDSRHSLHGALFGGPRMLDGELFQKVILARGGLITTSVTHPALDAEHLRAVDRRPTPRVRQLANDLWSLRVPLEYPRVTSVNVYLVALTDGWLVVDTGSDLGSLQAALTEAGAHPHRVRALLVTHAHPDHSALAAPLCDTYGWPLLRGSGPVTAVDPLRDPQVPQPVRHAHCRRAGVPGADLALMSDVVVAGLGDEERRLADLTVAHGDAFDGRGARWEVVALPGHSPGQIGLWDAAQRRLIAADLAYPSGIPFIEWGDSANPYAEQLGSLQRAAALRPAILFPGHGRPDTEPELRIGRARREIGALTERLRRAVVSRPSTAYELACGLAPTNADPDVRQSHLATTLAILDHLVADGRVAVDGSPLDGDRPRVYSADD